MEKLFPVAYGKDGFAGDSSFYVTSFDTIDENVTLSVSLERLQDLYKKDFEKENPDGDFVEPVGFWLLKKADLEMAKIPYDVDEGGSDGESYLCNKIAKVLCSRLAVIFVGIDPANLDESEST